MNRYLRWFGDFGLSIAGFGWVPVAGTAAGDGA